MIGKVSREGEREGKAPGSRDKPGQALAAEQECFLTHGSLLSSILFFWVFLGFFPHFFCLSLPLLLCSQTMGMLPGSSTSPSPRGLPAAIRAISHSFLMALAPGSVTSPGRVMGHPMALPCPAPKSNLEGAGVVGERGGRGEGCCGHP